MEGWRTPEAEPGQPETRGPGRPAAWARTEQAARTGAAWRERAAGPRLAAAVKSGNKERIASELLADGDTLSWLYYETFGEERYRYDGTEFRTALAGEGMVLTGAASVFYGSFGENGPEGRCTALQAVELEKP